MVIGRTEKELHDRLVRYQIETYQDEGTQVLSADIDGWNRPQAVGRHIPDIVARRQGRVIYNECETCTTIGMTQTREQLEDFSRHGLLDVTIPKSCFAEAKEYVRQWGIAVHQWWLLDGV